MKALLFSDLHLDRTFTLARQPEGSRRRRQSIRDTLVRIVDLALDEHVDVLMCGGDLYEQDRVTPDTSAFLQAQFARLSSIRVLIAPGNHDWFGPDSIYARNTWSANVHIFDESVLRPYTIAEGLTLWGAAHIKPAGTESFLDRFSVDRGGVNIALFHGSERNWLLDQGEGKQPHAPFDAAQIEASGLQHALLGHYHRPKHEESFTYPGNPTPLEFGEDGERGAVIVDIDDNGLVERRTVGVAAGQVRDLSVDLSGISNANEIRDRVRAVLTELTGAVRLKLSGEIPLKVDFHKSDLHDLGEQLDTFAIDSKGVRRALNVEDYASETTVRGEFIQLVRSADLPSHEEEQVIITGLRALDDRDDLEVE